ncbi:MAG: hypothetical protein ABUT20_04050 [Bacteroidota bacterium]
MRNISMIVAIFFFIISAPRGQAQKIDSALNILATQFPAEKIYIHYDKEYYVAGETIWLKAYFYSDGKPSGLSTNFYLQFSNRKGEVICNKTYPIIGAVAKGNIDLPDSLPQGLYTIKALTAGMMNHDKEFIYQKNIFVYKPSVNSAREAKATTQKISLQFFPESGYLVDGLLTVSGFKAVDQWDLPVEVNGIIKTDDGTTVAPFKSFHDGIGKVQFKPVAGKKYSAYIEDNGIATSYPLPEVQSSGINLKVQDEKGGKVFILARGEKDKGQFETINLVVELNNRVVYENEISFEGYPSIKGHLVTDSLPSGILHFTVFNKNDLPLAERLSFIDNNNYAAPATIDVVKTGIDKRAENVLELNFPSEMQRSASISVTDATDIKNSRPENIFSQFLLTGDLKGYIHNPAYYFSTEINPVEKQIDSIHQALDNLMLTQGWSRYSWSKILAKNFPEKKYADQFNISVSGIVKDDKDKELISSGNLNIYLEGEDSSSQSYTVPVDLQGRFQIDSLVFFGQAKLFYSYLDQRGKQRPVIIHIDESAGKKIAAMIPGGLISLSILPEQNKENISRRFQYAEKGLAEIKELEKVVIQSKSSRQPIDIVNEKYTNGVFRSMGKVNIDNINDPPNDRSMNGVDFVINRVRQVEIQGGRFVNRKNFSLMSGQKWLVDVFINEAPASISELKTLRVDEIAMVKFYEAGFVGVSSSAPGGAIAVYTKKINNNETRSDKLNNFTVDGYSIIKEYYSPNYNLPEIMKEGIDNRTTLYWSPDVYTDNETKSVKISFFNNDFSKKFRVVVEGFDAYGKLIHIEKTIGE